MRILILGAAGRHRSEAAIARAAESLGHEALVLDAIGWRRIPGRWSERLVRWQANRFSPDLVICTRHAIAAGEATLRALLRGRQSVFWYFDALTPLPAPVIQLAHLTQRSFATYGFQVEALRAAGVGDVKFLPQGFDPDLDGPAASAPERYRCDLSFVGSGQYPRRYETLRSFAAVGMLQIRGPNWEMAPLDLPVAGGPVHGRAFAEVVRGAGLSIGIHALDDQRQEHQGGTSNRLWKVLGAGGCFLGEYVDNIEEFARHGEHALWYRDPDQGTEIARAALADPAMRVRIAAAGHTHALAHHTYAHRLALLLAGQGYTSM
jgi:Glycosyl transferases group 1